MVSLKTINFHPYRMNYLEKLKNLKLNTYNKNKLLSLLEKISKKNLGEIIYEKLNNLEEGERQVFMKEVNEILTPPYKKVFDYISFRIYFYDSFYTIFLNQGYDLENVVKIIKIHTYENLEIIDGVNNNLKLRDLDKDKMLDYLKDKDLRKLRIKVYYQRQK